MRMPVKVPGPVVTAMRSTAPGETPASARRSRTIGASASPWPRSMATLRAAAAPSRHSAA